MTPYTESRVWHLLRNHDATGVALALGTHPSALLLGCLMASASYPTPPNITASRLAYVASTLNEQDHPGTLRALHSQGMSHYALNTHRGSLARKAAPYARGELGLESARTLYLEQVADLRPDLGLRIEDMRRNKPTRQAEAMAMLEGTARVELWLRGKWRQQYKNAHPH